LDPVCWDTFDADTIWAQAGAMARERRISTPSKGPSNGQTLRPQGSTPHRDRPTPNNHNHNPNSPSNEPPPHVSSNSNPLPSANRNEGGAGTWRRGVALPPPSMEENRGGGGGGHHNHRYNDAENPEDLWDDPGAVTAAAMDFSAFGGSLDDQPRSRNGSVGSEGFDLGVMSEAAQKFEEDIHGTGDEEENGVMARSVDAMRPLADAHTTIRSGSGDDVNVFEDFGAPTEVVQDAQGAGKVKEKEVQAVKSGEKQTASSRLMSMIGVTSDGNNSEPGHVIEEDKDLASLGDEVDGHKSSSSIFSFSSNIPKNPWGDPVIIDNAPTSVEITNESTGGSVGGSSVGGGLDLAARLKEVALEKQTSEQQHTVAEQEQERLQREEQEANNRFLEEEKRRMAMLVQQQAEQARQQQAAALQAATAHQQQPQPQPVPPQPVPPQHNQLELILIERISTILENNWGRSDLGIILQTLHNEDSRVIPLLGSVDALRALIARHPRRIAIAKDPTFGADIAVLGVTNSVWQQQQQAAEEQRRLQLQQEQQKMIAAQQQEAAAARAKAESRAREAATESIRITNDPWFYADPQGNVQGPFGGEEMRQWLEAGYFKGDLPISQNPEGSFVPLSSLFRDLTIAFKPAGPSEEEQARIVAAAEAEAAAEAKTKADAIREMEEKAAIERAQLEKAEAEAKEAAEQMRLAQEATAAAAAAVAAVEKKNEKVEDLPETKQNPQMRGHNSGVTNKKQSDQLKMLLGLGGDGTNNDNSADTISHKGVTVSGPPPQKAKESPPNVSKPVPKTNINPQPQTKQTKSKPSKKVPSIVVTPQIEKITQSIPTPTPAPAPTPTPAWGGAGAGKVAGRKKSMSEIQKEEAKIAAEVAKQRGPLTQTNSSSGRSSSSGGWANIAASGGTGAWSGAAVIPSPAPVTTSISTLSSTGNGGTGFQQARSRQQVTANSTQQQAMDRSTTQKTMEEFGANGKMTPILESWCKEQMRKLNGSEDLTLVAFCMTLSDPIEIKQYITAYLGSTPQVNNFATEFINRKSGNPRQEQWETTAKKGRKKKGVAGNYKA